jgi:cytochrome c oxidase assembly protein subunit 15
MSDARKIALWLFACCAMVMIMTVIGAITRLTESGLSITEWNVVMGTLPPLNQDQWLAEFEKYKASPEFSLKHFWMGVEDFKKIFFWEWLHRLWGRLIGLAFAVPLVIFWMRRRIPHDFKINLMILLLLGAAQGYMGWYMVKSGLVDQPSVSHYRLAAHLSLALIVYAYMLWTGLRLWMAQPQLAANSQKNPHSSLIWYGSAALLFVSVTIIWGAFVAGLDAGLIYNTFPLMGNGLIPPEMWAQSPPLLNLFENHASVQFVHRWLGVLTGLVVLFYAWTGMKLTARPVFMALAAWVFVQIGLGLATLLSQVWIPVAVLHQLGAVILLSLVIAGLQTSIPARARLSA